MKYSYIRAIWNGYLCVHFGSHWLGDMAPLCEHIVGRHKNIDFLKLNVINLPQQKNYFDSVREYGAWEGAWNRPLYLFLFSVDFMEITMISQSTFSTCINASYLFIARNNELDSGERLGCLGYFQTSIFECKFIKYICYDMWHTSQALMKWNMKVPKS